MNNNNNGLIGCLLSLSKPSRKRTVRDKDKVLVNDAPKNLVSSAQIVFIPNKSLLKDIGGLQWDSKDAQEAFDAMNHPAFKCSNALHELESVSSQLTRYLESLSFKTDFDRILPLSEEEDFLAYCKKTKLTVDKAVSDFFQYYDEMCVFWQEACAKHYGQKWADVIKSYTPPINKLEDSFDFIGETRDLGLRSSTINPQTIGKHLYKDISALVNKWVFDYTDKATAELVIHKKSINKFKALIEPKLVRYCFLDNSIKTLAEMVRTTLNNAEYVLSQPEIKQLDKTQLEAIHSMVNMLCEPSTIKVVKDFTSTQMVKPIVTSMETVATVVPAEPSKPTSIREKYSNLALDFGV